MHSLKLSKSYYKTKQLLVPNVIFEIHIYKAIFIFNILIIIKTFIIVLIFQFFIRKEKQNCEFLFSFSFQLVAGSTVIAFEEVCPERIDLLHKNYRKLCNMLIDIDEWGQVAVINMLVRYARTQFLDPNKNAQVQNSLSTGLGKFPS